LARHERKAKKRAKKMSRHDRLCRAPGRIFYWSKEWRRLRLKVFAVYGRKCMLCQAVDIEMHVDHIEPRSKAPHLSLTFENLQVLCRDCNMEKSDLHAEDYREDAVARELDLCAARAFSERC
jgi:5-methylcytosine-specific restriction endonuclease McrA